MARGISTGWWITMAAIAVLTIGGCFTVPHLGWTGWLLIIVVYLLAGRAERLEERVADLEESRRREASDDYVPPYDAPYARPVVQSSAPAVPAAPAAPATAADPASSAVRVIVLAIARTLTEDVGAVDTALKRAFRDAIPHGIHPTWREGFEALEGRVSFVAATLRLLAAKATAETVAANPKAGADQLAEVATIDAFTRFDDALSVGEDSEPIRRMFRELCAHYAESYRAAPNRKKWFEERQRIEQAKVDNA